MQLGYVITYVDNVDATLSFYEKAFGLKRRFLHESGTYGELETGETKLSFAEKGLAEMNGFSIKQTNTYEDPLGVEIALVTEDVEGAYQTALKHGAVECQSPQQKPWGRTVAYVRDINGFLVELCTPMAG